jgi:HTH-type transcriptional regulator / antitoxin HigA
MEMIELAIDLKAYGELLAEKRPTVIHNDEEHAAAMEYITQLAQKGDDATREELELLNLLATLIEDYERKRWPIRREKCSPRELLAFLMEENGLKQADLSNVATQSNISAILAGRRPIGAATAVKLGKRFHVSPDLFLGN